MKTMISCTSTIPRYCAFVFIGVSVAFSQSNSSRPAAVVLPGTESLTITSVAVPGQEYALSVYLPRTYADTSKRHPVIYVLDGQWDFPLVQSQYGQLYYDGFLPPAIIVGITWGGTRPNHDSLRARDLTPSHGGDLPQSGNAANFLRFMKTELFPFIESRYRAAGSGRALMGSSFGGLFTLFALFEEPGLFERYILTSPALRWDRGYISTLEKRLADRTTSLPVRLFMAQAELEGGVPTFSEFAAQLGSRHYAGLQMQTRILEGMGHSSGKAEGFSRGLQWAFARPSLSLDAKVLDRYVGVYEVQPQMRLSITRGPDGLVGTDPGGSQMPLYATSASEFYAKGTYVMITFLSDGRGMVTGADVEMYSGMVHANKVE